MKCNFDGCAGTPWASMHVCTGHVVANRLYCNSGGCANTSVRNGMCAKHAQLSLGVEVKAGIDSLDAKARKEHPVARGVLDYFPNAIMAIANVSYVGNEQHNPGEPMHWAKEKSADHADCIVRHLIQRGTMDTDKLRHTAKMAWRAIALLETELTEGK